MVNHFKRIQHVFLVLDARKCWMKNYSGTNFIQHHPTWFFFFVIYEMLDEIGAFKRIYRGWLGQHGLCYNTNMWPSILNTSPSFSNSRPSFWFSLKTSKAWPSVWKARPIVWKARLSVWKARACVLKQALCRVFC